MSPPEKLTERRLPDAMAELQAHVRSRCTGASPTPTAWPLPTRSFLLRRETRGIRFQLEMLKPDLDQSLQGIENTIVVFGSARFPSPEDRQSSAGASPKQWRCAAIAVAQTGMRNAQYYDQARLFARLVAQYSAQPTCQRNACSLPPVAAPASWRRPTAAPMKWGH